MPTPWRAISTIIRTSISVCGVPFVEHQSVPSECAMASGKSTRRRSSRCGDTRACIHTDACTANAHLQVTVKMSVNPQPWLASARPHTTSPHQPTSVDHNRRINRTSRHTREFRGGRPCPRAFRDLRSFADFEMDLKRRNTHAHACWVEV